MAERMSTEERTARIGEIKSRMKDLNGEFEGLGFTRDAQEEWDALVEELGEHERILDEEAVRRDALTAIMNDENERSTERPAHFQTRRSGTVNRDPYDMESVRRDSRNREDEVDKLRDNAMFAIDKAHFGDLRYTSEADAKAHVERLMATDGTGEISRRILTTGNPHHVRAFGKFIKNGGNTAGFTPEEQRAFSTTSTGIPIPYTLDPTLIPTSNFSVNPFRAISRNVTLTGSNQWLGATSGSISAAYAAEGTEASDNTPTLTQPSFTVLRAQAFVPFSFEAAEDWPMLQADLAMLFSDAKNDLEATKFYSGTGTVEPQGIMGGAGGLGNSQRTQTGATATFAVADVYSTEANLPPRWRPNASFVLNRAIGNRIRQFDTAGGAQLWTDNLRVGLPTNLPTGGQLGNALLGYPAYELSTAGTSVASGSTLLIIGDFSRGFVIVDRVGLDVSFIPHLFGTANNFPSGQHGMYARWRNTSGIINKSSFQHLDAL